MNLIINWDVSPEIIDGWRTPNLYGLLFVTGLIIGYFVIKQMFRKEQIEDKQLDSLVMFMIISIIVGARLGHVLFMVLTGILLMRTDARLKDIFLILNL